MDAKLRKLFIRMTKITMYAMVFCISLTIGICSTAGAQQKLLKEISIDLNSKEGSSLIKVIKEIEKSTDFLFLYSQKELKNKSVNIETGTWNMSDLLHEISGQAKLSIKRVNETISVTSVGTKSADVVDLIVTQQQITGNITDDKGEALPGASVVVSGTTTGTITDIDGNYALTVPSDATSLDISFVGMKTQTIMIQGRSVIDVQLAADIGQLEEVVVIGFGTREKKDLTGSISQISGKDIEDVQFPSPQFALQGKTTGVRVINSSGDPTAAPTVYVRGIGTWQGGAQPLYVVDGQVINPRDDFGNDDTIGNINPWTFLNPGDIESMTVLKDASAAAIYGSRAANGVILITTRRGKSGRPKVEFTADTRFQNVDKLEVLPVNEMMDIHRERWTNSTNPNDVLEEDFYGRNEPSELNRLNNFYPQYDPTSPYYFGDNPASYDWQEALLNKNAVTQNYSVRISGASETSDYYFSVGYTNQESVYVGKELNRYNVSTNLNTDVSDYVRTGLTARISYHETLNDNYPDDIVSMAQRRPYQPIYDPNNIYGFAPVLNPNFGATPWSEVAYLYTQATNSNEFATAELNTTNWESVRSAGIGFIEIEPISGLSFRGSVSADWQWQRRLTIGANAANIFSRNGTDPSLDGDGSSKGNGNFRDNLFINLQYDLNVTYNKVFGDHSVNVLLGAQDTRRYQRFSNGGAQQITTTDPVRIGWSNNLTYNSSIFGQGEAFWFGYVARGSYNYDSRYYLDVSYRRDASNGFPEDTRWGNFYAFSGAWRISDETFMSGLTFIDDLKLRGGWGQAGNDANVAGGFAYLSRINATGTYALGSGNGDPLGIRLLGNALLDFPNTDIQWEVVNTTTIGFDGFFLNRAIEASVEYYSRTTDGILQQVQLAPSVPTNAPTQNIGSVVNSGIEISLGYNTQIGDLNIHVDGNISTVKNEVTALYQGNALDRPNNTRIEIGRPIDFIYGYQVGGMFQSHAEAVNHYLNGNWDSTVDTSFVAGGDLFFKNVYGDPNDDYDFGNPVLDTAVNANDRDMIGKTIPGFIYGLNISLDYKGIYLTAGFYGEGDVDKINTTRQGMESMSGAGNYLISVRDRYTAENTNGSIPRAVAGDPAGNNRFSDRWVESAAFFRLNQWQLGYRFPQTVLSQLDFIQALSVFVGGQNNLLFSNWSTLDPVNDQFPLPKSYNVGLKVTF